LHDGFYFGFLFLKYSGMFWAKEKAAIENPKKTMTDSNSIKIRFHLYTVFDFAKPHEPKYSATTYGWRYRHLV
jgi:hypothetical protein